MLLYNYLTVPSGGPAAVNVDELGGAERVSEFGFNPQCLHSWQCSR